MSWMVNPSHIDQCDSYRQSTYDQQVYFAVSESTYWDPTRTYDCPYGYHWASTDEGYAHFTSHADGGVEGYWHEGGGEKRTSYFS